VVMPLLRYVLRYLYWRVRSSKSIASQWNRWGQKCLECDVKLV